MTEAERATYRILDVVTEDEESLWSLESLLRQHGFVDPRQQARASLVALAENQLIRFWQRPADEGRSQPMAVADAIAYMDEPAQWELRPDSVMVSATDEGQTFFQGLPYRPD